MLKPSETRTAHYVVNVMFFVNGALFGVWASRIPAIQQRFALEPDQLGLLLLLLAAGAVIAFPLSGKLCDHYGFARVTRLCALFYTLSLFAIAFSPTLWLLAAAVLGFGALHGAMDVAMNGRAAEVEKQLGRAAMSRYHAMFSIGAGVGAASGAMAAYLTIDYPAHFALCAALCFILVVLSKTSANESQPHQRPAAALRAAPMLPSGALLAVAFAALASALCEGAVIDWSAVYLVDVLQVADGDAALGLVAFSITMVGMRWFGDRFIDRFGRHRCAFGCATAALAGSVIVIAAPQLWLALAGFALCGVGFSIIMPMVFSTSANLSDRSPGSALAGVAIFGYGGMLLGPPLIGFIASLSSLRVAFTVLALASLWLLISARAFALSSQASANVA